MGGNVFYGSAPIKKQDIKPTLAEFVKEFVRVFPKAKGHLSKMKTLGSAGKKDQSGDLDLALDEKAFKSVKDWGISEKEVKERFEVFKKRARTATKEQLMKRAMIEAIGEKLESESSKISVDIRGSGNGTLFCQFPQYSKGGKELGVNVQVDINIGSLDWLSFAYYSDSYEGNIKGLHRTQLMLACFTNKGFTFSHNYGVKDKETQEIVAKSPEEAIRLLSAAYMCDFTPDVLNNYHKLQEFLEKNLDEEELHSIWDRYLRILDSTRCDIPTDLQDYWLENQDRLGLKGKYLPEDSKLYPFREEE